MGSCGGSNGSPTGVMEDDDQTLLILKPFIVVVYSHVV